MKKIILTILFVFILMSGCTAKKDTELNLLNIQTETKNIDINIEIAKTQEQKAQGLMNREFLAKNSGMLFLQKEEQNISLWMKNTLIPLDIIFINKDNKIIDILRNLQPCKKNPCQTYSSKEKAKYILELNAGFTENNNINIGNQVIF